MAKTLKKAPDIKTLQAEIKYLKAENRRMDEVLCSIQTTQSRKLLYDWLTLADAKQIGTNIGALCDYFYGDITAAQLKKTIKAVPVGK